MLLADHDAGAVKEGDVTLLTFDRYTIRRILEDQMKRSIIARGRDLPQDGTGSEETGGEGRRPQVRA